MPDVLAIQILKARYFRALDTKDWDLLRSLFVEDVEIDVTDDVEGGRPYRGRDRFVDVCATVLAGAVTVHGHTPEIELTSETTATGVWAMEDWVDWGEAGGFRGAGHYHERYVKVDGRWRIAALKLTRLHRTPL